MTALAIRQAVANMVVNDGNEVATVYFYRNDQIPFAQTPALVITSPEDDETFKTLGQRTTREQTLKVEVEYLDAPLVGDDLQAQMATVETWFEIAKSNLRNSTLAELGGGWVTRLQTVIDQPLIDEGRVLYHGVLHVWFKTLITS